MSTNGNPNEAPTRPYRIISFYVYTDKEGRKHTKELKFYKDEIEYDGVECQYCYKTYKANKCATSFKCVKCESCVDRCECSPERNVGRCMDCKYLVCTCDYCDGCGVEHGDGCYNTAFWCYEPGKIKNIPNR